MFKKTILITAVSASCLALFAQELTHESLVINIEVPVRVFKGSIFVDNLTADDFEVYEDGKLQKIEAVYLIKKTKIERKEEKKKFSPETSRNFYLFFEITDYAPRLKDALNYFFHNVLLPGDELTIVTPMNTYRMKSETFSALPKEEAVNQLKGILRKDALMGSSEYRSSFRELEKIARELESLISSVETGQKKLDQFTESVSIAGSAMDLCDAAGLLLSTYSLTLKMLENIRYVDQQKLLEFSNYLREKEGQKHVFLFYQREFIPVIEQRIISILMSICQDSPGVLGELSGLFQFYRRDISLDVERVKQAFADSSISIHFMFFTKPAKHIPGVRMEEHSEDIFSAFSEMAKATGGLIESSANPGFLFKRAAEASENYYLLYYAPINYNRDGKFKNIKVKVKNKNYRIMHRAGYFSN